MTSPAERSPADREALRALIVDSLDELAGGPDSRRSAEDLMRALDAYIESAPTPPPREVPVPMYPADANGKGWILWGVLACGIIATITAGVLLSGGALSGIVMLAIWVAVIVTLAST